MEACYSGSMWVNLPTDINVYAVTAANQTESSWASYCQPNNVVNGKAVAMCLGDFFSTTWLEQDDNENLGSVTF